MSSQRRPKKKRQPDNARQDTSNGVPMAEKADRHDLYQQSVQVPEADVAFFKRVYKREFKHAPKVLREDFCGTAAVCCEWVKGKKGQRTAMGVDLDAPTLDWGREHNLSELTEDQRQRITLVQTDVRTVNGVKADVLAAQNFSYFIFRTRDDLRTYLEAAHANLADKGMMVLDIMGGSLVVDHDHEEEERDCGEFTYIWHKEAFNPYDHEVRFHIHFRFEDESEMRRAFTYDWRLWSIPEVRELLEEAGFRRVDLYWEGTNGEGEGDGEFSLTTDPENDPAWVSYLVAYK
ncbi:MAG: class I SAM-dependent methyltransferase [Deltaproteobacteria bacterium]|nr:class I SAM-dependent methyltransferase [Deltaproteobacteria bacterium]